MQTLISGEVYNLNTEKIKLLFKMNFDVSIRDKSVEEIYVENEFCYIDVYDNSQFMKNTFLIGGVYRGDYFTGVEFINKLSNLLSNEKVSFELTLGGEDNTYSVKQSTVKNKST